MDVTIKLLENAMKAALDEKSGEGWTNGRGRFLVDGFPRKLDQAHAFDNDVRRTKATGSVALIRFRLRWRPRCCSIQRRKRSC